MLGGGIVTRSTDEQGTKYDRRCNGKQNALHRSKIRMIKFFFYESENAALGFDCSFSLAFPVCAVGELFKTV